METTLYERLINSALRYVSYRPRSEKELRDFLQRKLKTWKAAGSVSVEKAISRLRELEYVDDAAFARWWVDQRSTFRPKGIRVIRFELEKKGVDRSVIAQILKEFQNADGGAGEEEGARKLIQKKIVLWTKIPIIEQKKKLYTFLAQRGFSYEIIEKMIDEFVQKDYNTR